MEAKVKVLKSREVAHILDCSPDDVIVLAQKGKLKATKQGRFWKYAKNDVMAYKRSMNKRKVHQIDVNGVDRLKLQQFQCPPHIRLFGRFKQQVQKPGVDFFLE